MINHCARLKVYLLSLIVQWCKLFILWCYWMLIHMQIELLKVRAHWWGSWKWEWTYICRIERFSNDCRKTKTKAITPTNHNTGTNSAMNQSQFPAITCNSPEARERSPVYGKPIVAIFNTIIQFQFNEIQFQFNEIQFQFIEIQVQFNEIQFQFNEIQVQFNEIQFQFNENSTSIQWKFKFNSMKIQFQFNEKDIQNCFRLITKIREL